MVYNAPMTERARGGRICARAGSFGITLERLGDLETLWEALGDDADEAHIPYWTELWPASFALAEWLCSRPHELRGFFALDMGCGLGFLSIIASRLGARTLGMDLESQALAFCRKNAALNGENPEFALMDWARPAVARGAFGRILGADILYEARFIEPLAAFLAHALAPAGVAWIADPGRSFFPAFTAALEARGLCAAVAAEETVGAENTGSIPIKVKIWRIIRRDEKR